MLSEPEHLESPSTMSVTAHVPSVSNATCERGAKVGSKMGRVGWLPVKHLHQEGAACSSRCAPASKKPPQHCLPAQVQCAWPCPAPCSTHHTAVHGGAGGSEGGEAALILVRQGAGGGGLGNHVACKQRQVRVQLGSGVERWRCGLERRRWAGNTTGCTAQQLDKLTPRCPSQLQPAHQWRAARKACCPGPGHQRPQPPRACRSSRPCRRASRQRWRTSRWGRPAWVWRGRKWLRELSSLHCSGAAAASGAPRCIAARECCPTAPYNGSLPGTPAVQWRPGTSQQGRPGRWSGRQCRRRCRQGCSGRGGTRRAIAGMCSTCGTHACPVSSPTPAAAAVRLSPHRILTSRSR